MRVADAKQIVGQRVEAHTSMNGIYVGTLIRVTDDRPWRGVVLIDGVLEPAESADRVDCWRRGYRIGEEIEVGGVNIIPTKARGVTYIEAVERDLAKLKADPDELWGRNLWVKKRIVRNREQEFATLSRQTAGVGGAKREPAKKGEG